MAGQHQVGLDLLTAYATLAEDQAAELGSIAQMLRGGGSSSGSFGHLPESGALARAYATRLGDALGDLSTGQQALGGVGAGLRSVAATYGQQEQDVRAAAPHVQGDHAR